MSPARGKKMCTWYALQQRDKKNIRKNKYSPKKQCGRQQFRDLIRITLGSEFSDPPHPPHPYIEVSTTSMGTVLRLESRDVRRHVKRRRTCAVRGVGPSVPHQKPVVGVKACYGQVTACQFATALSPDIFAPMGCVVSAQMTRASNKNEYAPTPPPKFCFGGAGARSSSLPNSVLEVNVKREDAIAFWNN